MKYMLLTKEQLNSLSKEFANFLASQQIDVEAWNNLKKNKSKLALKELEIFCDIVWEDTLTKAKYIEHYSPKQLDLFKCGNMGMHRIVIKINKPQFNFYKKEDFNWFLEHLNHEYLSYFQAQKKYKEDRNLELFELIKKGGIIANNNLYNCILKQFK